MRKLWRLPEASMYRVKHLERRFLNRIDHTTRNLPAAPGKRFRLRNRVLDHLRLLDDVAVLFFVRAGDAQQDAAEAGTPVTIVGWEIRAAVERLAIGSEKGGERPSALPADGLHRNLITAVNVGTLVAIDLHRDEVLVDDGSDFRIVVGFAVHHMAPVAPHGADVEQHGLVVALCGGESVLTPLAPLNGLMHGGTQVGGGCAGEGVEGGGGHASSL